MKHSRGFGVLEMLLASVLLVGVIVVLMKSFYSSSKYNNDVAYARNYAIIVNQIAQQFYAQAEGCQNDSGCDFDMVSNQDASTYLDMSSDAIDALNAKGIYPSNIKVTTCYTDIGDSC